MRAPRRRSRALAGAGAGSRSSFGGPARVRGSQERGRFRSVLLDASYPLRRAAGRTGRVVTPLRAAGLVAALAALALAVSQFMDFRSVAVGSGAYSADPGLESVAPAPQVEQDRAGSAHAWVLLPLALLALLAVGTAATSGTHNRRLRGRWRLARIAAAIGALAVLIALAVDVPAGLDEGPAAVAYEGARASLEEGFWVELSSAAVLAAAAMLVSVYGRWESAPARRRARR